MVNNNNTTVILPPPRKPFIISSSSQTEKYGYDILTFWPLVRKPGGHDNKHVQLNMTD